MSMAKKFLHCFMNCHHYVLVAEFTKYCQRCQYFKMVLRLQVSLNCAYHKYQKFRILINEQRTGKIPNSLNQEIFALS